MDVQWVMARLDALGTEARRKHMKKRGAGDRVYGVLRRDLHALAEELGRDQSLALALWDTQNADAMTLAAMIMDPAKLERDRAERMVGSLRYTDLLDELMFDAVAEAPYAAELREAWIGSADDVLGRAGWTLVVDGILRGKFSPEALSRYVDRVERGLAEAQPLTQEAMNRALCETGIRYEAFTHRCIAIGERLGVYRDQKVPRGCTSAYAPDWIKAGLKRRRPPKTS